MPTAEPLDVCVAPARLATRPCACRGEPIATAAVAIAGDTGAGEERHAKEAIESIGYVADVDGLDVEW